MHLAVLSLGAGCCRLSRSHVQQTAHSKLEMLLVYTWYPRFLSTRLVYWEEKWIVTLYNVLVAVGCKNSARSVLLTSLRYKIIFPSDV